MFILMALVMHYWTTCALYFLDPFKPFFFVYYCIKLKNHQFRFFRLFATYQYKPLPIASSPCNPGVLLEYNKKNEI